MTVIFFVCVCVCYMGRGYTRVVIGGGDVNRLQKHIYIILYKEAYNKGLFSHQMLLMHQRMFLSLKSSLLQKHMLQLLDSQKINVQLMKRLKLRMQFAILLALQGSLLTEVWNYIDELLNVFTCIDKVFIFFWPIICICCLSVIAYE